jgi:Mg-chelatase subunit ChlD
MADELPDCDAALDLSVALTDVERAELVQRLFEEGPGALERFVKEKQAEHDSSIAKAVERFRSLLEDQNRRVREKFVEERSRRMAEERARADEGRRRLSEDEKQAEERRRALRDELGDILARGLLAEPLVQIVAEAPAAPAEPEGFLARIARAVRAFFASMAAAFSRLWHWLRRKLGIEKAPARQLPSRGGILIEVPSLEGALTGLDARFDGAFLTSPDLKRGIEARIEKEAGPWERLRFRMARRFSPGSYARMAKQAFRRQVDRLLARRRKEADRERDELEKRIAELRRQKQGLDRGLRAREAELESERDRLLKDMGRRSSAEPERKVLEKVEEDLGRSGLIARDAAGNIQITARLIDRFAEIALAGELRKLPSRYGFALGRTPVQQGTFERDRLRTVDEVSRLDLVESLMAARLSHPESRHLTEDDVRVNRELTGSTLHVVLVFDKSSSMAENRRIQAAKKAVLALFKAVKRRDRRNIVDLVGFDTEVRPMDLVSVWESRPAGFTNTGEALKVARTLVEKSPSDLKMIYLITDGYPEAYTENGKGVAGDNPRSLAFALEEAAALVRLRNVRLVHILLEPKEKLFVDAAQKIAGAAHGKLITTDPNRLAADMLMDYTGTITA